MRGKQQEAVLRLQVQEAGTARRILVDGAPLVSAHDFAAVLMPLMVALAGTQSSGGYTENPKEVFRRAVMFFISTHHVHPQLAVYHAASVAMSALLCAWELIRFGQYQEPHTTEQLQIRLPEDVLALLFDISGCDRAECANCFKHMSAAFRRYQVDGFSKFGVGLALQLFS